MRESVRQLEDTGISEPYDRLSSDALGSEELVCTARIQEIASLSRVESRALAGNPLALVKPH